MPVLTNGYPTAYRDGQRTGGGLSKIPLVAGDPFEFYEEDRRRQDQIDKLKRDATTLGQALGGVRAAARIAVRLNPYLNGLMLALDASSLMMRHGFRYMNMTGYLQLCSGDGNQQNLSGYPQCQLTGGFTVSTGSTDPELGAPRISGLALHWTWYGQPFLKPFIGMVRPVGVKAQINLLGRTTAQAVSKVYNPGRIEVPEPLPQWIPVIDPHYLPILHPPRELPAPPLWLSPYRQENPYRAPSQQRLAGYYIPGYARPARPGNNVPRPMRMPMPGDPPLVLNPTGMTGPDIVIEADAQADPNGAVRGGARAPTRHHFRPPGPKVKERKGSIIAVKRGVALTVYNWTTEAEDAITAVWEALPLKYRTLPPGYILPKGVVRKHKRPSPTPQQMLADIYRHMDKLDYNKAVDNIVLNQLEDRFFGTLGRIGAKASRRAGLSHGLNLGPLH